MPALYKDGKNYSHNGPQVDVELTKGSPNAAPSGKVYDKFEEVNTRLTQYKVKEYTFEYTNANEWMGYDIDESNAFLDGSSYLDAGDFSLPIGFKNNGNDVQCFISYQGGIKRIEFFSSTKTGTIHAFVRYK